MSMMLSSHELPNFWERVAHPEVVVVVAADTPVVAVDPMEEMVLMMPFSQECPNSSNLAAVVAAAVDPQDTLLLPNPMAPQAVVHPPEDTPVEVVAAVEFKSDPPNLPNKLLLSTLEVDNNVAAEDTLPPLPHMALHPPEDTAVVAVDPQEDTPVEVVVAVAESALAAQREPNKSLSSTWEVAVDPRADTAAVHPVDIKPAVPFPQTLIHCS